MNNILAVSTVAVVLASAPAFAADVTAPVIPPVVDTSTIWDGFYAGLNAGLAGGTFEHPITITDGAGTVFLDASADVTASGFLGGVQAGYNYQFDNYVFGIEGDIQLANVKGAVSISATDNVGIFGAPGTLNIEAGTTVDLLATIRPRLGFVHDQALFYITGGLAYGNVTSSVEGDINGTSFLDESESNGSWGYTVGGGVEFAVSETMSFKTEYLYTDLGANTLLDNGIIEISNDVAFHTVRAGVNFHF